MSLVLVFASSLRVGEEAAPAIAAVKARKVRRLMFITMAITSQVEQFDSVHLNFRNLEGWSRAAPAAFRTSRPQPASH